MRTKPHTAMMKYMLVAMALPFAGTATAQFEIGPKAGANYHFQSVSLGDNAPSGATAPEGDNGLGFHFGGFVVFGLSENIYLRPELLYSTRSWSSTTETSLTVPGSTTELDLDVKQTMSYLEVPVLFGLKLSQNLSVQAGPGFGILAGNKVATTGSQRVTTGGQTTTTSLDETTTDTEGLRTVELAGVLGLGYHAENGLDIGIRYWRGLNTINEDTDFFKTNQNIVQLSVGFALFRN